MDQEQDISPETMTSLEPLINHELNPEEVHAALKIASRYPLTHSPADGPGVIAKCVSMPGIAAWGSTEHDANEACYKQIATAIVALEALGVEAPRPKAPAPAPVMRSIRVDRELDERVLAACERHVPRLTYSEFVRKALSDTLDTMD